MILGSRQNDQVCLAKGSVTSTVVHYYSQPDLLERAGIYYTGLGYCRVV